MIKKEKMKNLKIRFWLGACILALGLGSCSVRVRTGRPLPPGQEKPLPPGQAKKITGSQSAAPYAPGHNK